MGFAAGIACLNKPDDFLNLYPPSLNWTHTVTPVLNADWHDNMVKLLWREQ